VKLICDATYWNYLLHQPNESRGDNANKEQKSAFWVKCLAAMLGGGSFGRVGVVNASTERSWRLELSRLGPKRYVSNGRQHVQPSGKEERDLNILKTLKNISGRISWSSLQKGNE